MQTYKKVYALVTQQCNLHCPHCNIQSVDDHFDRERFTTALKEFDGSIVIFGGEPTYHEDRLFDCIINVPEIRQKVQSISTNLIKLDDRLINLYRSIHYIATSWNPHRFTDAEYRIWVSNLHKLKKVDIDALIMITLTDDLFEYTPASFFAMAKEWDHSVVRGIRFEYLVAEGLTPEFYQRADEWMCNMYEHWDCKIPMDISNVSNWYFDCSEIYTLYPTGELVNRCPNHTKIVIPSECYSCERMGECRPCRLQPYCSFPKRLYSLIQEKNKHV